MIQRLLLLSLLVTMGAAALLARYATSAPWIEACVSPAAHAEAVAADKALDRAMRNVEQAWSGGSRYAAAKIGLADPAEVERTTTVQREAFHRLERARAACQVAA